MKITKTQMKFVEVLRAAGALDAPVDWRALKVNGNAVKALIERGVVIPPEGEVFGYRSGYCYGNGPVPTRTVRLDPAKVAELTADEPKAKAKGTCPCCFRSMTVKNGLVVRHGWKEIGGGYGRGRGWHSGSCFGARGYEPYEVSNRGTLDLLKVLEEDYLPEMTAELERLRNRPARIRFTYRGVDPVTRRYADLTGELEDDGVALDAVSGYMSGRNKSYAYQLSLLIKAQEQALSALRADISTLAKMAAEWKAAEVTK